MSAIALVVSVLGCGERPKTISGETFAATQAPSWEDFKSRSTYVGDDGAVSYVVEGDIGLDETLLREYYDSNYVEDTPKSTVVRSGGVDQVWSATDKLAITYCVANSWGNQKPRAVADMAAATSQWMSAANVKFTYVPSQDSVCADGNTGVKLNVLPNPGGGGVTCYPNICRHLLMSYSAQFGGYTWLGAWTHELGHSIGLGHEHYSPPCNQAPAGADASYQFRLVNSYDKNSSLHFNGLCGSTSVGQMTPTDADGVHILYGSPISKELSVLPTEWGMSAAAATL